MFVPQNNSELNQEALRWLKEANEPADPYALHLLTLAFWGLENGARGEWPDRDQAAIELQVGHLCGWTPTDIMDWLMSNPNGPEDPSEQEQNLVSELQNAESPNQAAAFVLNVIYSRQVSVCPALQPAASEA